MIIINMPHDKFTVDFESRKAPCPGCLFFGPKQDEDDFPKCQKAAKPLSTVVVDQCLAEHWRTDRK